MSAASRPVAIRTRLGRGAIPVASSTCQCPSTHASAFQLPGDEDHFRADATGRKFYDPTAKSCTKFLADTVAAKFGFDEGPLAELIEWAEIIDGALFPSAKMAVELKEPALQLMTFIENNRQPET